MINLQTVRKIRCFLASPGELEEERKELDLFFNQENKKLMEQQNIFLELRLWEQLNHSFTKERFQDSINQKMPSCDIFIFLFYKKIGKYTREEFYKAYRIIKQCANKQKYLFVFLKSADVPIDDVDDDILERKKFIKEIEKLEQLHKKFTSTSDLINQLKHQLDLIIPELCKAKYSFYPAEYDELDDIINPHISRFPKNLNMILRKEVLADDMILKNEKLPVELNQLLEWLKNKGSSVNNGKIVLPILEFANIINRYINENESKNRMTLWIQSVKTINGIEQLITDNNIAKDKTSQDSNNLYYLVVKLEQESTDIYNLQAWLFENNEIVKHIDSQDNISFNDIYDAIEDMKKSIRSIYRSSPEALMIEFIIPKEIFNNDIENLGANKKYDPIGLYNKVAIRSLDRIEQEDCKENWQRLCNKWKNSQTQLYLNCEQTTLWNKLFKQDNHKLWLKKNCVWIKNKKMGLRAIMEKNGPFVCFVLEFVPDHNYIVELIKSGVSIAVWPKSPSTNIRKTLSSILKDYNNDLFINKIDFLPELIRFGRNCEWDKKRSLNGYVSLLWDDFDRQPPEPEPIGAPTFH